MTVATHPREVFRASVVCAMVVGDNYHQCGKPGVAILEGPARQEGRCLLHGQLNERVIRNQPQRWSGWNVRWL